MTKAWALITACLVASALTACGDDSGAGPRDSGLEAGGDAQPDGTADANAKADSGGDSAVDGGGSTTDSGGEAGADGGACNFAVFVVGLIQNHTNATDRPSADLGQNCVDNMDSTEFKTLFP
jgi:hypothetical protein